MNLLLTALAGLYQALPGFLMMARGALLVRAAAGRFRCGTDLPPGFVRCFSFVKGRVTTAIVSDLVYAGVLR